MATCKNCGKDCPAGRGICDTCLNSWPVMLGIVQTRHFAQLGEPTRQTSPLIENDMKRLSNLWKRDRLIFEKEVAGWYAPAT